MKYAAKDRYNAAVRRRGAFNQRKYGEHLELAEKESDFPVVVLPADSHDLPGSTHIAGGVDGGEINQGTPAGRNHRSTRRNTVQQRVAEDHESLEHSAKNNRRQETALPVTAQRITQTRTQSKRRRLSVRDARRLRRDKRRNDP